MRVARISLLLSCLALLSMQALSQESEEPGPAAGPPSPTMFPHSDATRWYLAGQSNIILQAHGAFHSPYEGTNSLKARGEYKTSLLGTLFSGFELHPSPRFHTEVIADVESSGGRGISQALGLAGFTNLDVVRNPNLGSVPYLARLQLHQTIGLSGRMTESGRTPFSLATEVPERRIVLIAGKMSLPDYFDENAVASDSHLQFTNWTIDNTGAWDYAADTRGYTWGVLVEADTALYSLRYAVATMPTIANGIHVDYALRRASGQNVEFESRHDLFPRAGHTVVHLLSFANHANMGTYRVANDIARAAQTAPDVTSTRRQGTLKYGFAVNVEQDLPGHLRAFSRWGWNEGQHESFAYTEVDETIALGADYAFVRFHRPDDKLGVAFVSNAIKRDHQDYLALGGLGFLLGDGHLAYAREDIVETYYNLHAWRGMFFGLGGTFIEHPGYNQARGPVFVPGLRSHIDF